MKKRLLFCSSCREDSGKNGEKFQRYGKDEILILKRLKPDQGISMD